MKRLVTSMILGTMIVSTASMSFANAKPMEKITVAGETLAAYELTTSDESELALDGDLDVDWVIDWYDLDDASVMGDYDVPSFQDYMKESKDFLKTVDAVSETKLKGLYEEAVKLEEAKKYDDAMKKWDDFYEIYDGFVDESKLTECIANDDDWNYEKVAFEDYMKEMKDYLRTIPSKDMAALKELYESAEIYMDEEKYEEAEKAYQSLFTLLEKYYKDEVDMVALEGATIEMPTYKDFIEELSDFMKPISKDDAKAMETHYNKAVAAEKEGKYQVADSEWSAFDKLLDKYLKDAFEIQ